jgi:hypothetical protein
MFRLMLHDLLNIKYFFHWKFNKIKINILKNIGESEYDFYGAKFVILKLKGVQDIEFWISFCYWKIN